MIEVGVFGSTGYTGLELIQILMRHPHIQLRFSTSASHAGESLNRILPTAPDMVLVDPNEAPLDAVDVVFLCLPHTASASVAIAALDVGTRVVDLSADFRLSDVNVYHSWYGSRHPAPELLPEAIYGLTEITRGNLTQARLVANPGCYPTSVLLALYPVLKADAIDGPVIVDAKSGVSGAGRKPKLTTHFVEVADNLTPYNIGRAHRHLPEMEQALGWWSDSPPKIIFSPHLVPAQRGLLSTIYVTLRPGWSEAAIREQYTETYSNEPFIQLLQHGESATYAHVNHTNRCAIGITVSDEVLILTSAIDNLIKGASGQAVQNMNVIFGMDETTGLL